ncbi:Glyoxalase/Bleomycin resistance protein/Dioxygenase superfamily protein [Rhodococcoides kyotonense]|uniref:Glyoxalase/Bleomycin resistance protein/Dioxygenase superfamily protein n=1 Tax=Rhodococcoides kyotonense TaxID=398843 RepID=A0A239I3Z2_9NOCA|nr:Glyoxalase/Bleomycin resistance protein/Dioxygenase superfamily protein [Rhodococcus kyotonensis]
MGDPRLGAIVQTAYVVDDVRAAAERFAKTTGAGPFFVRRNPITVATGPNGSAAEFDHTSAYGQWGHIQIELVETHSAAPAAFFETTQAVGRIHHVAMMVESFADQQRTFTDAGWPALLTATTPNGNNFAFHDARPDLGHLVEIYEPRPTILELYRRVARAADDWDGSNPVREM